jgi:lipoprotein-anchoring transpeptidase ErfK/SrfK
MLKRLFSNSQNTSSATDRPQTAGMSRRAFAMLALGAAVGGLGVANPAQARETRDTSLDNFQPGTIVIKTSDRKLHLVLGRGQVITYSIAVGKAGKTWTGVAYIDGKFLRPAWSPPLEIRLDKPGMPTVIPAGAPENPMGAAAMTLSVDEYAIHGTNNPSSIGTFASYGCFRMYNHDVLDLFARVDVGTRVVVLK